MDTQIVQSDANVARVMANIDADLELAESTKRQYRKAVVNYVADGGNLLDADQLRVYMPTVGTSTRAFLSAAVKRLCKEIEHEAKSMATPDNVANVQATIYRAEAVAEAVSYEQAKGQKAHTWLSQAEVKRLMDTCGDDLAGTRDRVALALMVGAGLRRTEAASLTFADVILKPVGDRMRSTLAVKGKGAKNREVPISDDLANLIDRWSAVAGVSEGRILRSIMRRGELRDGISTVALYDIVQKRGAQIDKPDLQPHDLRRTYAQLGYDAGVPVAQISKLLGHASIETTQQYLNLDLDLECTVSDFVPI